MHANLVAANVMLPCRVVSEYAKSKLEAATQQLIDLIFSDTMFQEAMQVYPLCMLVLVLPFAVLDS